MCFDKVIEIDPNYENAWSNRGNSLRDIEKFEEGKFPRKLFKVILKKKLFTR